MKCCKKKLQDANGTYQKYKVTSVMSESPDAYAPMVLAVL